MGRPWLVLATLAPAAIGCGGGSGSGGDADAAPVGTSSNYIFVSSATLVPGKLGSVDAADQMCTSLAHAANLAGTYKAWLSTSTQNAADRLGNAHGWVRLDGQPFADLPSDIANGQIYFPPTLDEHGAQVTLPVATATDSLGHFSGAGCSDFTTTLDMITTGVPFATAGLFTSYDPTLMSCAQEAHIYCLGVDHGFSITPPETITGRVIFVSSPWVPSGGLAAADALCASDASVAGLTGQYLAMLPANGNSVTTRFPLSADPIARLDGIKVADSLQELLGSRMQTSPNRTANGIFWRRDVWTGATNPTDTTSPNCMNWTSSATTDTAIVGWPPIVTVGWFGADVFKNQVTKSCQTALPVYCLQH